MRDLNGYSLGEYIMKHNAKELVDIVYELATAGKTGVMRNPDAEQRQGWISVMRSALVARRGNAPMQVSVKNVNGEYLFIDHQYPQDKDVDWITHPNCAGGTMQEVEGGFKNAIDGNGVIIIEFGNGDEDTYTHVRGNWWHLFSTKNNRHHVPKGAVFEAYEGIREDAIAEFYGTRKLSANHHRAFESALRMAKCRFDNR